MRIKELFYGSSNQIVSVEFKRTRGGTLKLPLNEEAGLGLFNTTPRQVYDELHRSRMEFTVIPFTETVELKLALDRNDVAGLSANEIKERDLYSKIKHVNILVVEQPDREDGELPWILVELPTPVGDIKYVPVILHKKKNGVCVHPDYHKIFLRSFTDAERHTILGFIYLHGEILADHAAWAYEDNKPSILSYDQYYADYYNEKRDTPKRIPTFKYPEAKGRTYDFIFDNYENWVKQFSA